MQSFRLDRETATGFCVQIESHLQAVRRLEKLPPRSWRPTGFHSVTNYSGTLHSSMLALIKRPIAIEIGQTVQTDSRDLGQRAGGQQCVSIEA